jgi:hypothetical protein
MKNVDEELKLHILRKMYEFYKASPPKGMTIPKLSEREWQALAEAAAAGELPRRGRGRPFAINSSDDRTKESFQAFVFVNGELHRTIRGQLERTAKVLA